MCKLFNKFEDEIKKYCIANQLDFSKVKSMQKCWGKNDIWLQHFDKEKGKSGLMNESPAKIVLKITINNGAVSFVQTEYTNKYLH